MTTLDIGLARLRSAAGVVSSSYDWFTRWLKGMMPTGLYGRALLIIITPMVVLQSVVAFVFMERHWNTVTRRLSAAVTQDISALIDVYRAYPQDPERLTIRRIALERLGLSVDFLPVSELPPPGPKPFFSLLDQALSQQISQQIRRPFWIDTVGRSNLVEIRIRLDDTVMRVFAQRSAAYASNSEIFLWWMIGTSLVLLFVAILFLRNQIKPILRLADAAESFGKGRDVPGFKPRGAREVRRAAQAFIEMKRRVERTIEQRTTMLAGVSHDLRTILTRLKLELVLLGSRNGQNLFDVMAGLKAARPDVRIIVTHADRGLIEEVHFGSTPEEAARLWWDISWIWGPPEDHLETLLATVGVEQLVFGTGQPLRIPEISLAKLDLLDLTPQQRAAIEVGNARAALAF